MIDLRHITKSYRMHNGWHKVLDDISVCLPSHRNIGILGLNGAGKSTLLRIIGNVEPPDSGELYKDIKISWPIGFTGGILPEMTGREGTRLIARIYGSDIYEVENFVEEFTELGRYFDMEVKTYSSGMRSRLGFAISMAMDFDCYLVDEVTSAGDRRFREKYRKEFMDRHEKASLLMVSHQPSTIVDFCDMAAVLVNGKLTLYDTVEEGMEVYGDSVQDEKRT